MSEMITYYPWSEKVLHECLLSHDNGEMPTLDLEFSAKCTCASCIYCDSKPGVGRKNPRELNTKQIVKLITDARNLGLKWIYACGLGEPLEDDKLEVLVPLATKLGIKLSIFSNGILIDRRRARWLYENNVCIILKLDTFKEKTFDKILGKKGAAKKIYNSIDLLLDAGYGKKIDNKYTDLAFSIVPTKLNLGDIEDVVRFAKAHNIFPSIGELEQAGRASYMSVYGDLSIGEENMLQLKKRIESILWKGYTRPVCPTIITGLHIDNIGHCVADRDTGLNCKWFLLNEPRVVTLGNIKNDNLSELFAKAMEYRWNCFRSNKLSIESSEATEYIFGGCGGSPREIIKLSRAHLRKNIYTTNKMAAGS